MHYYSATHIVLFETLQWIEYTEFIYLSNEQTLCSVFVLQHRPYYIYLSFQLPPDERQHDEIASPVFSVSDWNPEPPAGLQYISLLPVHKGYESISDEQHDLMCKITPTALHRKQRRKELTAGKITGRNIHGMCHQCTWHFSLRPAVNVKRDIL